MQIGSENHKKASCGNASEGAGPKQKASHRNLPGGDTQLRPRRPFAIHLFR